MKKDTVHRHIISVLVDNEFGTLARIVELFSGRGYNIESLTVAEVCHEKQLSRITITTTASDAIIEQIIALLNRLVPVHSVQDLTTGLGIPSVERELALIKVKAGGEPRVEALRIAEIFRAKVVDATNDTFVFEITGGATKIDEFVDLMRPLGLIEITRTGSTAISRGKEPIMEASNG